MLAICGLSAIPIIYCGTWLRECRVEIAQPHVPEDSSRSTMKKSKEMVRFLRSFAICICYRDFLVDERNLFDLLFRCGTVKQVHNGLSLRNPPGVGRIKGKTGNLGHVEERRAWVCRKMAQYVRPQHGAAGIAAGDACFPRLNDKGE